MPRGRRANEYETDDGLSSAPIRHPRSSSPREEGNRDGTFTPSSLIYHGATGHSNARHESNGLGYVVPMTSAPSTFTTSTMGPVQGGVPVPMTMQAPVLQTQQVPVHAPPGTPFPVLSPQGYFTNNGLPGAAVLSPTLPLSPNYVAVGPPGAVPAPGTTFVAFPGQGPFAQQPMMSNVGLSPTYANHHMAPQVSPPYTTMQLQTYPSAVPQADVRHALPHEVQAINSISNHNNTIGQSHLRAGNTPPDSPPGMMLALPPSTNPTVTTTETPQQQSSLPPSTAQTHPLQSPVPEETSSTMTGRSTDVDNKHRGGRERSSNRRGRTGCYVVMGIMAVILGVGLAVGVFFMMNQLREDDMDNSSLAAIEIVSSVPSNVPSFVPSVNPSRTPSVDPTSTPTTPPTKMPVPTFSPTTAVWGFLLGVLGIEDPDVLDLYEFAALQWMATTDPQRDQFFERSTGTTNEALLEVIAEDVRLRYVMTLFYYSTGGDSTWTYQHNFLTERTTTCDWNNGLSGSSEQGVICSSTSGNFLGIQLSDNSLIGTLPEQFSWFPSMAGFVLDDNFLSGTLPSSWGPALTNIFLLNLHNNMFTGTIPESFYENIPGLQHLLLYENDFSGTIPTTIGNLMMLETLGLDDNPSISGTIPTQLTQLPTLVFLNLAATSINGTIPDFDAQTSLTTIVLGNTDLLQGTIPSSLYQLPSLEQLVIQGSNISGTISPLVGQLDTLVRLFLDQSAFTGTVPTEIGQLTLLEDLILGGNQLSGNFTTEMTNLQSLERLVLENNLVSGTLPDTLPSDLPNLWLLTLQENLWTGNFTTACASGNFPFSISADCGGDLPKVICPCCFSCS